jgi:hypothetical protein
MTQIHLVFKDLPAHEIRFVRRDRLLGNAARRGRGGRWGGDPSSRRRGDFTHLSHKQRKKPDVSPTGAKADLDEAWQIAEGGSMKLHMADILLHCARLSRDRAVLEAAARLIEETGYHRRDEEVADAREALNHPQG